MRLGSSWIRAKVATGIIAIWILVMMMLGPTSSASAAIPFCLPGTAAGECDSPRGIAVDSELERVYVADQANHRINVFDTAGTFQMAFGWGVADGSAAFQTCTASCQKGIAGSGRGQFSSPGRIAVDNDPASPAHHAIYVGTSSFRVQRFDLNGNFVLMFGKEVNKTSGGDICPRPGFPADVCGAGVAGTGEGQFGLSSDPISVGSGGVVYVGDKPTLQGEPPARILKFEPSGGFIEPVLPTPLVESSMDALAVDSSGDFYVGYNDGASGIHKYHPDGSEYEAPYPLDPGLATTALAIDGANRLFAARGESPALPGFGFRPVALYDASGKRLSRFGYGAVDSIVPGLAPSGGISGEAFAFVNANEEGITFLGSAIPPGPIIPPNRLKAVPGNTKASLSAEVNPEGKASKFRFEYVEEDTCENDVEELGSGHCFAHAKVGAEEPVSVVPETEEKLFRLQGIQATIGCAEPTAQLIEEGICLTPETDYRFRIVVKNSDGEAKDESGKFVTLLPLEIVAIWSENVGTDAAGLGAEVNPLGIPATGYFEYVDDATFQEGGFTNATQIPNVDGGEAPLSFGAGVAPVVRAATLESLEPATTYYYRLISDNPLAEPITSAAHTFTTFAPPTTELCSANEPFRTGLAVFLPDCRAYEMVSPLEKSSGDILALPDAFSGLRAAVQRSSVSGEKLTYGTYRSFGEAEGSPFTSQYIAARDAQAGWQSHNIAPPRGTLVLRKSAGLQLDTEYKAFSPDLCQAWLRTLNEPQLEPRGVKGFPNIYRRTDQECGGQPDFEALTQVELPDTEVENSYPLELQGVSADGSYGIYAAPDNLTSKAPNIGETTPASPGDNLQLYEWGREEQDLRFLCVLPGGAAHKGPCSAGTILDAIGDSRTGSFANAISDDGKRIFWSTFAGDIGGPGKIYLRQNPFGKGSECATPTAPCSLAVSAGAEVLEGSSTSQYWGATADGSAALFSTGSTIAGTGLYRFEVEGQATSEIAPSGVLGVMGASEDIDYVYFVSSTVLTNEENSAGMVAQAGKPNLYLAHEGTTAFIATLSSLDANPTFGKVPFSVRPSFRQARVSADGQHAAFTSTGSPTGYDNIDAISGKADAEVYLYDAVGKELVCVSCNPSGSRPVGENLGNSINQYWAAAHLPVWQNALNDSRLLTEDGRRLYFEATDSLVARDTNGVGDVYQWEEEGAGGCDQSDPSFVPDSSGCIELISAGKSPRKSEFIEADPSGKNVFFATLSSLVPQDYGLVDIYDARVGGGFEPPPTAPVDCEGEACQNPPPSPEAPTPTSSAYEGPGNVAGSGRQKGRRCPASKRKVSKGGKARCVRKHKHVGKHKASRRDNQNRRMGQ